jgi:alkylated DNA repair dioxygenase AlkB
MLSIGEQELAQALEEVGRSGVCSISGALSPEARRKLGLTLERLGFQRAPESVREVRQDFGLWSTNAGPGSQAAAPAPLLALAEAYAALLWSMAVSQDEPWLADFRPTDIHVQRYSRGSAGISPHRDSRLFIKLISIFSLGSAAELSLFRERRGPPLRRFQLNCGDLFLLRAPGFANCPSTRPLHSVSGPADDVRYSITLRMKEAATSTAS